MINIIIFSVGLVIGTLFYIINTLYVKNKLYEITINQNLEEKQIIDRFIEDLYISFKDADEKIKSIDKRGGFKSDDEIGFIFKLIENKVNSLTKFIEQYYKGFNG